MKEVTDSGLLLGRRQGLAVCAADSHLYRRRCRNRRRRTPDHFSDGVKGIVGGDCSGVTGAMLSERGTCRTVW